MASQALEVIPNLENDLPELKISAFNWQRWLAWGFSLALTIALALRVRNFGWAAAWESLPERPAFWFAFIAYYCALPLSEWIIFRRLWRLPARGFVVLLRKLVSNEILLGYSGEAYFYTWARQHAQMVAAPFGAIKDVSILSALAGNLMTLAMLILAWPLVNKLTPEIHAQTLMASSAFLLVVSFIILGIRKRLFTLESDALRFILSIHLLRLVATTFLSGLLWHVAVPAIPLFWLIILATLQLLVTRLPFVPNKDLLFANLTMFLVGNDGPVSITVTMIATMIVMSHLLLGGLLILPELIAKGR